MTLLYKFIQTPIPFARTLQSSLRQCLIENSNSIPFRQLCHFCRYPIFIFCLHIDVQIFDPFDFQCRCKFLLCADFDKLYYTFFPISLVFRSSFQRTSCPLQLPEYDDVGIIFISTTNYNFFY